MREVNKRYGLGFAHLIFNGPDRLIRDRDLTVLIKPKTKYMNDPDRTTQI